VPVEYIRKDVKNVNVRVYPPDGRVSVSAPRHLSEKKVRIVIAGRMGWIREKRREITNHSLPPENKIVTGEIHYYRGKGYRLQVVEEKIPPSVNLSDETIELRVRPGTCRAKRKHILIEWYRDRLKERIPKAVARWEVRLGVDVEECRIKKMKTRWGSCNPKAKRIWVNLWMIQKPDGCLDYILVHEMLHFFERRHNERFRALLEDVMPDWKIYRDKLA